MISFLQQYAGVSMLALVAFVVFVLVARPDRDPDGDGLYSVYLSTISIASLYLVLTFGVMAADTGVQAIIVDFGRRGIEDFGSPGFLTVLGGFASASTADDAVTSAVVTGLLALAAGVVLTFHLRRRAELLGRGRVAGTAADRVDRAFLGGVCFVVATIGITAFGLAGFGAFRIIAPDITGEIESFEREQGISQLIAYGLLVGICIGVFRRCFWSMRRTDGPDADEPELIEPT